MDLQNMTTEELDALLTELVEVKSEKAKAHRQEVLAEVKKRATYKLIDKPIIKGRALKNALAGSKRKREQDRKARVKEMEKVEAERARQREAEKAEAERQAKLDAEAKAQQKAARKAAKAAAKAEIIEIVREDEQPM